LVLGGVGLHLLATLDKTMTGFVLLIGVAFLARLYSTRQMHKMTEPVPHSVAMDVEKNLSWLRLPQFAAAKRFSVFVILMHMSVGIAAPFFSVYMLVDLQYSYLQFMLNTGAAVIVQVWTLNYWGRISDIFGSHSAILVSSVLVPVLPALWLVSDNFIWLLVVQLLAGFAWAGFSLSTSNALYELIPQSKMATYQALHNVLMAFAVFVGGMIGVLIIESFPVRLAFGTFSLQWSSVLLWVFLVSGICRASVAVFMLPRLAKFGRGRKSASGYQLIFRLVRFNAFMGLVYEVVAKTKRPS
jgi:MFS family permease